MDTQAGPDLEVIYAPVQPDVSRLHEFLREEFCAPEALIHEILQHVARFRGKQMRPAMLFLAGRLGGQECTSDHVKIGAVVELIHTATLVHDDVLDDALMRRNVETVHRLWGERAAVLIGDYIYSRAFQLSTEVDGMASILSETTHTICEGELLQLRNRFCPDMGENTYLEIIAKKTAILYAISCMLGGRLGGLDREECDLLREFGLDLGMAFQIVDDCLDYVGTESEAGKSLGTDLHQNKVTLPLIYLMESLSSSDAAWVKEQLKSPLSRESESRIQTLVDQHGVVPACLDRAEAFVRTARERLAQIDDHCVSGSIVRDRLDLVGDYILRRQR